MIDVTSTILFSVSALLVTAAEVASIENSQTEIEEKRRGIAGIQLTSENIEKLLLYSFVRNKKYSMKFNIVQNQTL